jgi:multidrug efflux pump subunit AcrB
VPLADIVTVERVAGFSSVVRENGLRVVTVSGDLAEDDPARATEIQAALRGQIVPGVEQDFGVMARYSGQAEQEREFLGGAALDLHPFALVGIYLCLAWIFASWSRPVVVMSVIPFGWWARSSGIGSGACRCRCSRSWGSSACRGSS